MKTHGSETVLRDYSDAAEAFSDSLATALKERGLPPLPPQRKAEIEAVTLELFKERHSHMSADAAPGLISAATKSAVDVSAIEAVHLGVGLVLEAITLTEKRSVIYKFVPLAEGLNVSAFEEVWSNATDLRTVKRLLAGERAESEIRRPLQGRAVVTCPECSGEGEALCSGCKGKGEITRKCPKCKGAGEIERQDTLLAGGAGGKTKVAGGVVLRREQCLACRATGSVTQGCGFCHGSGQRTCQTCEGRSKVVHLKDLVSGIKLKSSSLVLRSMEDVKDRWLRNTGGAEVNWSGIIDRDRHGLTDVESAEDGRYIGETVEIKIVPVTRWEYRAKRGAKTLFLVGDQYRRAVMGGHSTSFYLLGLAGVVVLLALLLLATL